MRKNYQKPESQTVVLKDNLLDYIIDGGAAASQDSGGFAKPGIFVGTTGTTDGTQITIRNVWED